MIMIGIVDKLLHLPGEKLLFFPSLKTHTHTHTHTTDDTDTVNFKAGISSNNIPVDILDTEKHYTFFFDVPGLSKSDIQVTVEDGKTLVIRGNGKRKREDGEEEEGCKYIRLERKASPKFLRKFRLPDDSNVSAISAKCENGVLTVSAEKLPPPQEPKKVEVAIS